jgi:hypothetical protein
MFTKIHGPLDNFSFFQYENYLQEISNRIKEKQNIYNQHTNHCHNEVPYVFHKEIKHNIPNPFYDIKPFLLFKIFTFLYTHLPTYLLI